MSNNIVNNTPKLRFPEFQNNGEWEEKKLFEIAKKINLKNKNLEVDFVLTNSASDGIVSQRDYFKKDIANKNNLGGYYIVEVNDFIYNPRISSKALVGSLKRNKLSKGIMSPLYIVMRFKEGNLSFYEHYFESTHWHNYMRSIANMGAKFDRLNLSSKQFFDLPLPFPSLEEQQKVSDCIDSIDSLIFASAKKLDLLNEHKRGLLQNLFPKGEEDIPSLRFSEFKNYPEWKEKEVGNLFKITRGYVLSMELLTEEPTNKNIFPVFSSQTKNNGLAGYFSEYLYKDSITWTTDGANAGDVNYREGKFYCTNVCGVLINKDGYSNLCIAEIINYVSKKHVSYVGNPKLMNGVMSKIKIKIPCLKEQAKISNFLLKVNKKINLQVSKIELLKEHRKALLQQLFLSNKEF